MIYPNINMRICGAKEAIEAQLKKKKDFEGMEMLKQEITYLSRIEASSEEVLSELEMIAQDLCRGKPFIEAYRNATDARPEPNIISVAVPNCMPDRYDLNESRMVKTQAYESILHNSEQ